MCINLRLTYHIHLKAAYYFYHLEAAYCVYQLEAAYRVYQLEANVLCPTGSCFNVFNSRLTYVSS